MESRTLKRWMGRFFWIAGAGLWLSLMAGAWSRAEASDSGSSDDSYSFSWLDPDKKIYVLQNRKFTKAGRVLVSALGGVGGSNPYRNVRFVEPRVAVFFSEALGVEIFYSKVFNSENTTYRALSAADPTTLPMIREIRGSMGGLLHWVPWYAKINVFNQILYFDWGFQAGAGTLDAVILSRASTSAPFTETSDKQFALYAGTNQQFFLSQNWTVRLDVLGAFYNAKYSNGSEDKTWFSNFQFGAGLGYRL